MPIKLTKIAEDLYEATATPPHVVTPWSTLDPVDGDKLEEELLARGAHQIDIGDALYEADPTWLEDLQRRRSENSGLKE